MYKNKPDTVRTILKYSNFGQNIYQRGEGGGGGQPISCVSLLSLAPYTPYTQGELGDDTANTQTDSIAMTRVRRVHKLNDRKTVQWLWMGGCSKISRLHQTQ